MNNHWIQGAFAVVIMFVSVNAQALDCEEKSPGLIQLGDDYYNLEQNIALTRQQKAGVTALFSALNHHLQGTAVVIDCVNNNGSFQQISQNQQLKATVNVDADGKVAIALNVYIPDQKNGFDEIIEYLNANTTYLLNELTDSKMQVVTKFRRVNSANLSSLHETVADIQVDNGVLNIRSTLYINGYFGQSRTFQLK
ncbi:MAG: hypothetical protein OEY36_03180 [Gammaproteobacteria bacterium]|nr:hypothetical protein [Gammaproteobacteria bacterium]